MNLLHQALQNGFQQSKTVWGSSCTIAGASITMTISQVTDRIAMELEGYMDDADYVGVISTADVATPPPKNAQVVGPDGLKYLIRGIKTDQSSYTLTLKKIDP